MTQTQNATALQTIVTLAAEIAIAHNLSTEAAMRYAIERAQATNPALFGRLADEVAA